MHFSSGTAFLQVPYRLAEGSNGQVKIKSSNAGKDFAPEEISAQILRKLTDDSAKFLNDKVHSTPAFPPSHPHRVRKCLDDTCATSSRCSRRPRKQFRYTFIDTIMTSIHCARLPMGSSGVYERARNG